MGHKHSHGYRFVIGALVFVICTILGAGQVSAPASTSPLTGHHRRHPSPNVYTIPQPSRTRPLSILQVGDSIGLDLGYGLSQVLSADPLCHLILDSVGDTGLTNAAYFNWPATMRRELALYHPRLVVIILGANDWQGMEVSSGPVQPGTSVWLANYRQRVGEMMTEATAIGARVLWVGLPIMGDPSFSRDMATLNTIFLQQTRLHRGVWYVPTWKLFSTPSGAYSEYLQIGGSSTQVRDADGVHIDPPAGTSLLGHYVVEEIDSIWHIHI